MMYLRNVQHKNIILIFQHVYNQDFSKINIITHNCKFAIFCIIFHLTANYIR